MSTQILPAIGLDHDAMMLAKFRSKVGATGKLERRIVTNLLARLDAIGYKPTCVNDGDDDNKCHDAKSAMEIIFNLDEAWLRVTKGRKNRTILLIMGNGVDMIVDYSYIENDTDGFRLLMETFDTDDYT